jgi:hypothetical protein
MKFDITKAEYYNIIVDDDVGAASKMLSAISEIGISLLAYKAETLASKKTRFTLFSLKSIEMSTALKNRGFEFDGPYPGIFVKGDDIPGSLAEIYHKLEYARIVVKESSGIANINRAYGVVLYLDDEDCDRAIEVLG